MGTPSSHSLPEHWTELIASRRQKTLCSERVQALKASCRQTCGKPHVTECPSCHGKLMDVLGARYREGEQREWLTQRRAFLHELDGLFQDAKDRRKRSLRSIEARIESEKEAWYRWVLRRYPEFIAVSERRGGNATSQDDIRGMLDDPDRSREELLQTMLDGIGRPPNWPVSVDEFADKVAAAARRDDEEKHGGGGGGGGGDGPLLKKLYIAEFFLDGATGEVLDNAQQHLDEYRRSDATTLEDVMDGIVADLRRSRSAQPQRDRHLGRLDELRRARTAFEQNKMRAKSRLRTRQEEAATGSVDAHLYDLPPCLVCGGRVSPGDVFSCALCQAVEQAGGGGGGGGGGEPAKLTVYCSEGCCAKGHDKHVDTGHDCEAADHCVQLTDQDVDMADGAPPSTVCCRACLDVRRATVYCSERCAVANIAAHQVGWHGGETAAGTPDEARSLVRPLQAFVEATLGGRNPGLTMRAVT